jgi:hypothetical protein
MLATLKQKVMFAAMLAIAHKPYGEDDTPPADPAPEPKSFPPEYVRLLREENKAIRLRAQEAEAAKKAAEDAAAAAKTDADTRVTAAEKAAQDRLLRAELKAAAIKAGITDLDGLKLADTSKLKLNDTGEIEGLDDFMKSFKEAKPYLFSAAGSSSSTPGKKPDPKGNEPLDATKMSPEEYAKAKAKMLAR